MVDFTGSIPVETLDAEQSTRDAYTEISRQKVRD